MIVVGLHAALTAKSHEPSAALIVDGRLVGAIEEERLNRIKTSIGFFPAKAVGELLAMEGLAVADIDYVFSDGVTYPGMAHKINRYMKSLGDFRGKVELVNHAYSHAVGAFLSGQEQHGIAFSIDGVGDGVSTLVLEIGHDDSGTLKIRELYRGGLEESLGGFYTVFTNHLGFRSIQDEYKVMGMAAYGLPNTDLSHLLKFDAKTGRVSGSFQSYLEDSFYSSVVEPVHDANKISQLTGIPAVYQGSTFKQSHFDLAASVQSQFEKVYTGLIRHFAKTDGSNSVFLAGGCALNALANQKLIGGDFKYVSVMPAASDRGLGLASALYGASLVGDHVRPVPDQYLGSEFSNDDVRRTLDSSSIGYEEVSDPAKLMADDISEGRVIAVLRGRAEYGPRALGNRSILAHPFQRGMKDKLNAKIKFRESFRPFAPMVLPDLLDPNTLHRADLRHMTTTVEIAQEVRSKISEATHLDGSSRVQVIDATSPTHLQELLGLLKSHIGVGACINTSFNLAGEPLVNSPSDAIRTFYSSGLDVMYLEDYRITKA